MRQDSQHIVDEVLLEYLDGRLEDAAQTNVQLHLSECEACARRVQVFQSIETSLRNLPREHADEALTDRILEQTGISTQGIYRLAGVMAAVMAAVFVGGILLILFSVLGIVPTHASSGDLSFFDAPWKSTSEMINSTVGSVRQLVGGGTIGVSSIITTALSIGVIALLLGLDRALGRWMVRGDGAR